MDRVRNCTAIDDAYGKLVNCDSLGVFYATADGEILHANDVFLKTLGYSATDLPLHVDVLTPPEYSALDEAKRNEVHWTGSGMPWKKEYVRRDGSRVPVLVGVSLVDPRQGNCICFAMDMSVPAAGAEQLQHAQAACKEAFDDFQLIYFSIDLNGTIYAINTCGAERLGYLQEELLGAPLALLIHPEDREKQQRNLTRALSRVPELQSCEIRAVCKNTEVVWLRESIRGLGGSNNSLTFVVCADITQQKRASEQLERYHNSVRSLTAKTVLTEERERRLVAVGLHDRVGHRLAGAKFKAATLMRNEAISEEVREAIDDICEEIDQAIAATRNLTSDLSSPTLYDLGLGPALQALGEHMAGYGKLEIAVHSKQMPRSMPQDTMVIVHRVARELLFNIVKHAHAQRATLTTEIAGRYLRLRVTDDGVGVPFKQLPSPSEGFGLFSIREQIREIGGSFQIAPNPDGGTQAIVAVPIE